MGNPVDNHFKLNLYLEDKPLLFTPYELKQIKGCLTHPESIDFSYLPFECRELFDELGIELNHENLYVAFARLVNQLFNIKDKNIIEVGGGVIPTLAKKMSLDIGSGHITVYDPILSIYEKDTPKMTLVREQFDNKTDVSDTDLIVSLMPCKAAEVVVDVATKNNIDFIIGLCEGGPHGDCFDFYEDDEEWRSSLMYSCKRKCMEKEMGEVKTLYLRQCGNPYPIIYNERKRK